MKNYNDHIDRSKMHQMVGTAAAGIWVIRLSHAQQQVHRELIKALVGQTLF